MATNAQKAIIDEFVKRTGFHFLGSSRPDKKRFYSFQEGTWYMSEMKTFIRIARKITRVR